MCAYSQCIVPCNFIHPCHFAGKIIQSHVGHPNQNLLNIKFYITDMFLRMIITHCNQGAKSKSVLSVNM